MHEQYVVCLGMNSMLYVQVRIVCCMSRYALSGRRYLEERPELSNPTNSWKRLIEGVHLHKQGELLLLLFTNIPLMAQREGRFFQQHLTPYVKIFFKQTFPFLRLSDQKGFIIFRVFFLPTFVSIFEISRKNTWPYIMLLLQNYYRYVLYIIQFTIKACLRMTVLFSTRARSSCTCTTSSNPSSSTTPPSPSSPSTFSPASSSAGPLNPISMRFSSS